MSNITESQKIEVLKDLVNDEEIMMLYDSMNNCYRPMWANEWYTQIDLKDDDEAQADMEKYNPHIAEEDDINDILENGILEWEYLGSDLTVKIWW
jgi:hypothetical protein